MSSMEQSKTVSVEVRVKNEPIYDSISIPESKEVQSMKVKEEPFEIEIQTLK